jgi:mycothiol synthase
VASSEPRPVEVRTANLADIDGIRSVMEASFDVDDLPGFTRGDIERAVARLPADLGGAIVATLEGRVAGYCIPRNDDLTVHPELRRRGVGRALVPAAVDLVRSRGLPWLQVFVPARPVDEAFARAVGLHYHSSLWLLGLAGDVEVPAPSFPTGVAVRGLASTEPVEPYVELMNASFADHPTPLGWTVETVGHVHGLPEFDPGGLLLVTPADEPDRLIAFTRVELESDDDGVPVGWISLIGVLPAWRGRGLGRELLRWGVAHMRARGADRIELAVEALNERALGLYRRTGFEPKVEWPHWIIET